MLVYRSLESFIYQPLHRTPARFLGASAHSYHRSSWRWSRQREGEACQRVPETKKRKGCRWLCDASCIRADHTPGSNDGSRVDSLLCSSSSFHPSFQWSIHISRYMLVYLPHYLITARSYPFTITSHCTTSRRKGLIRFFLCFTCLVAINNLYEAGI